jgi:hypothetical protein
MLSVVISLTLAIAPQRQPQQLRPSPAALARAAAAQPPPPVNATSSSTWLAQMSDQVHHALVEAKKLEQRVAAATTTAASHDGSNINATGGVQGNALLREVTFKPGMMDAGLQTYRRSMLLHELATTCRLVVVLDDPDPSSRDAAFLSMWQLDGKSEPAQPVHANGGDGYRKLRVALSGLAWQKHDRAHSAYAKRFYEGRVDAGFYSTKWFWLKASHDKQAWLNFDQISNSTRLAAAPPPPSLAMSPPPPPSPVSPPLRFTPPSSPMAGEALLDGAASLLEEAEGAGDAEELAVSPEGQEGAEGQQQEVGQEAGHDAEEGEGQEAFSEAGAPGAEAEAEAAAAAAVAEAEAGGEAVAEAVVAEAEEGGAAAEAGAGAVVAVAAEGEHRGFPSLPAPSLALSSGTNSGAAVNGTRQHNATAHVELRGLEEEPPSSSPPVLGLQGLVCYKIIALFKQGGLDKGRAALLDALLPEVEPLPEAVAATVRRCTLTPTPTPTLTIAQP